MSHRQGRLALSFDTRMHGIRLGLQRMLSMRTISTMTRRTRTCKRPVRVPLIRVPPKEISRSKMSCQRYVGSTIRVVPRGSDRDEHFVVFHVEGGIRDVEAREAASDKRSAGDAGISAMDSTAEELQGRHSLLPRTGSRRRVLSPSGTRFVLFVTPCR